MLWWALRTRSTPPCVPSYASRPLGTYATGVFDESAAESVSYDARVAVESASKTDDGWVVFFDARGDGRALGAVRVGGIAVYDITDPRHARFVAYENNRDFAESAESIRDGGDLAKAGDLGPEGVTFLPSRNGPTVAVANEVSGTTTLFRVTTR